ncbi:MAG: DUF4239 domain-containing protein [Candidatus Obscuribacterales bacterium]
MASILGSFPFLIAVGACGLALSIGGLWLVRRYVSHETLMTHHDVASCMLSIIGTLYAVVLGLMVVGALSRFQQARQIVEMEANTLHDVFHLAQGLPKPLVTKVRQDCRSYATLMINEEWRLMEEGNASPDARAVMSELWSVVTQFKPADSGETNLQQTLLQELDQLGDCRNSRLLDAKATFDPYIWSAIISGGFILIVFTYFFGVENFAVQALMTGLVTIVLAINLLIVALFAYPYSGDVKVTPQPFANDLSEFK